MTTNLKWRHHSVLTSKSLSHFLWSLLHIFSSLFGPPTTLLSLPLSLLLCLIFHWGNKNNQNRTFSSLPTKPATSLHLHPWVRTPFLQKWMHFLCPMGDQSHVCLGWILFVSFTLCSECFPVFRENSLRCETKTSHPKGFGKEEFWEEGVQGRRGGGLSWAGLAAHVSFPPWDFAMFILAATTSSHVQSYTVPLRL